MLCSGMLCMVFVWDGMDGLVVFCVGALRFGVAVVVLCWCVLLLCDCVLLLLCYGVC